MLSNCLQKPGNKQWRTTIPGKKETNEVDHRTRFSDLLRDIFQTAAQEGESKQSIAFSLSRGDQAEFRGDEVAEICEAECQGRESSSDKVPQKCARGPLQFVLKSPVTDVDDELLFFFFF